MFNNDKSSLRDSRTIYNGSSLMEYNVYDE